MQQADVVSSNIAKVGHDGVSLFIKFNSGESYGYVGAPPGIFTQLVKAESVGRAFHQLVKNKFPHEHLTSDPFAVVQEEATNASLHL